MRAISLWQPWASLWCLGIKRHETRHWRTQNGPLIVHAAKRKPEASDLSEDLLAVCRRSFGVLWRSKLPYGALIGRVDITGCKRAETMFPGGPQSQADRDDYACGNFAPNRFAWESSTHQLFRDPIPFKGSQTIFHVPGELLREVA